MTLTTLLWPIPESAASSLVEKCGAYLDFGDLLDFGAEKLLSKRLGLMDIAQIVADLPSPIDVGESSVAGSRA